MHTLYTFLVIELKRFLCLKNVLIFLLVLVLCYSAVTEGIEEQKKLMEKENNFLQHEANKFKKLPNYVAYSAIGFNILFTPSPLSGIFINGVFSELTANIDIHTNLEIFENMKGKALFQKKNFFSMDFPGVILIFGILFAILYGYEALRYGEYSKSLASLRSVNKVFLLTVLIRFSIMILLILAVYGSVILFTAINGLNLSMNLIDLFLKHAISACLMTAVLFFLGLIVGMVIKNKWVGITTLVIIAGVLVFIIPAVINNIVIKEAEKIESDYKKEIKKFNILDNFEKRSILEYGKFDKSNMEVARNVIEGYYKNDYSQIEDIEKKTKDELAKVSNKHKKLSIWLPTAFYLLTTDELSSKGYENFLDFLDSLIGTKRKFLRFWIDRVYYNDPKVMVCFVKNDENIFRGTSKVGNQFGNGVLINTGYIIILFLSSFFVYRLSLFHMKKKDVQKTGHIDVEADSGDVTAFMGIGNILNRLLYNLFSGHLKMLSKKGLQGEILINEVDLAKNKYTGKFAFIPKPEDLPPGIKVKHLILFFASLGKLPKTAKKAVLDLPIIKNIVNKRLNKLNEEELFNAAIALTHVVKSPLYLINDTAGGKETRFNNMIMERIHQLRKENALVVYIATPRMITDIPVAEGKCGFNGRTWLYFAEGHRLIELEEKSIDDTLKKTGK